MRLFDAFIMKTHASGSSGMLLIGPAAAASTRRTATIIALLTVVVAAAALAIVALSGVAMNHAAERTEIEMVSREINRVVSRTLDEQKSVALWDEAVGRIHARNTSWLDDEIGAYLNSSYGHDEVYIVDRRNRLVYGYPRDIASGKAGFASVRPVAALLMKEIRGGARLAQLRTRSESFRAVHKTPVEMSGAEALRWSAHLLDLDGHPAVVSAMTVVPTTRKEADARTAPILVSVVRLDAEKWSALGRNVDIPDLVLAPDAYIPAALTGVMLQADDGRTMGSLRWKPHHPGHIQFIYVLPILVIATLWAIFGTLILLRRLIRVSRNLEDREREAVHLSYHDPLCDLPNRRGFTVKLNQIVAAWEKGEGERPLVAYLDLDRFKDVNDTLGHDVGDALVHAVGERLTALLPSGHMLARLGGDEFAVATTATDPLAGWKLGRDLCSAFADPVRCCDHDVAMSASIGIAIPAATSTSVAELMRQADIALYRAKESGRGRAVIFRPEMGEALERRRRTELDLKMAIGMGQLHLVYQPVLTIEGAPQFNSVEALLRWDHPERGMISPDEFIPIAETSGQMSLLGDWVLFQALKDSARWPGLQVAVNLSPVQLKADGFVRRVSRMVNEAHARPAQIIFEVTESVMMDSSGHAGQALKDLRELGFKLALDDFGTGYSSLSYLRRFELDRLKIDRSFMDGIEDDANAVAVIESVIGLGRRLGLEIVAEGIENEAQARLMKTLGCTHLQGWFVARPIESRDIVKMLDTAPRMDPIVQMLRGTAA
mgnify:FL=1